MHLGTAKTVGMEALIGWKLRDEKLLKAVVGMAISLSKEIIPEGLEAQAHGCLFKVRVALLDKVICLENQFIFE
ncbi:MAG: hypothetical protein V4570_08245 [Pseudomonadota bacterium]